MRVIGMISGTSFDAIEAVAAELELDGADARRRPAGATCLPSSRPSFTRRSPRRCRLRRRRSRRSAALDTGIGQRFAEVAAGARRRRRSAARSTWSARTARRSSTGSRAPARSGRCSSASRRSSPSGRVRPSSPTCARGTRRRRARRAAREPARRAPARQQSRPRARARSTSAGSRTSPSSAPAASRSPTTSGRPTPCSTPSSPPRPADGETFDARRRPCGARRASTRELLARFLDEPYYALAPPKSTGKELFHLDYVRERVAGREIATDDLLATLTALTAETVADDLRRLGVADVVAAGGGTRNPTLMAELAPPAAGRADRDLRRVRHPRGGRRRRSCSRSSAS